MTDKKMIKVWRNFRGMCEAELQDEAKCPACIYWKDGVVILEGTQKILGEGKCRRGHEHKPGWENGWCGEGCWMREEEDEFLPEKPAYIKNHGATHACTDCKFEKGLTDFREDSLCSGCVDDSKWEPK